MAEVSCALTDVVVVSVVVIYSSVVVKAVVVVIKVETSLEEDESNVEVAGKVKVLVALILEEASEELLKSIEVNKVSELKRLEIELSKSVDWVLNVLDDSARLVIVVVAPDVKVDVAIEVSSLTLEVKSSVVIGVIELELVADVIEVDKLVKVLKVVETSLLESTVVKAAVMLVLIKVVISALVSTEVSSVVMAVGVKIVESIAINIVNVSKINSVEVN